MKAATLHDEARRSIYEGWVTLTAYGRLLRYKFTIDVSVDEGALSRVRLAQQDQLVEGGHGWRLQGQTVS